MTWGLSLSGRFDWNGTRIDNNNNSSVGNMCVQLQHQRVQTNVGPYIHTFLDGYSIGTDNNHPGESNHLQMN